MHIVVCGGIGVGKTTLTKMLCDHYHWTPKFEAVDNNPYLDDFYKDMKRWSFELQTFFMNKRLIDVIDIHNHLDQTFIQDRSLFEDRYCFVKNLYEQGNMDERAYKNYCDLYDSVSKLIGNPDLLIYIRSSVSNAVSQIEKRGRDCETNISISYLKSLNEKYEDFISNYNGNIIVIDGDTVKFENRQADFEFVINLIDEFLEK